MKFRLPLWLTLLASVIASEAAEEKPAPIRAFDVATLSRLGREIHQHDQLAWKATDVVMAQVGLERLKKDGGRGWVVDISDAKSPVVRFLRSGANGPESLCDVIFASNGTPELSVPKNRELTAIQQAQAGALETAKARFVAGDLAWCGGNPNTVVLDDPDGAGFLVYFLRAKPAMDQVPVGGHYRFTVSADGKKVEQVDRLFASCLTMSKKAPDGSTTEMIVMSHVVSPTPLETHVFLTLQEGLPFLVTTMDGMAWGIEKGEISKMGRIEDLLKKQSSGPSKSAKPSKK
jgi:hypothetical protein